MRTGLTLVELCCGTAAVSLWAAGRVRPLTGYMGSKRQDASLLCSILGVDYEPPTELVLVDAGPWGDVWTVLQDADLRRRTSEILRSLGEQGDLCEVWPTLLYEPRPDPADRVAQYLCLQARAAGCIPVWWSSERGRWESPSGSRTETAHQRGGIALEKRMARGAGDRRVGRAVIKPMGRKIGKLVRSHPSRGLVRIATLADRIDALDRIDWSRVRVHHGDVAELAPIPGSVVYFDPPYMGCPRYAELLPRGRVLETAEAHAAVADLVVVSESETLPLEGWYSRRLRYKGKPEWLTMSRDPERGAEQLDLLEIATGSHP